jgi:hypothetical protein
MTTKIRYSLCILAVAATVGVRFLVAQPPLPATTGHVLLLDNERVVEGDIERVGDRYRVRRSSGETMFPADGVLRLCASLEDALDYLRSRTALNDPDERLRLARWCHLHGLHAQAVEEVKAAAEQRPDEESRRLLRHLQQTTHAGPQARTTPEEDKVSVPALDVCSDTTNVFCTRVQPILMNACANCHATGRGGAFKLVRCYEDGGPNHRVTQQNLVAVLGQVNLERPQGSPLLSKAVSAHAALDKAPLQGRQSKAFHTLEEWVQAAVDKNPQLRDQLRPAAPAAEVRTPAEAAGPPQPPPPPAPAIEERPAGPAGQALPVVRPQPQAPQPAVPKDPFDPLPFNRQMHPNRQAEDTQP